MDKLKVFGRPFVKRFALCYRTVVCPVSPVCDVGLLWPNGWMDQDATSCGRRPRLWPHCVRWGPSSSKGAQPTIFGTCLLWPNGWIHQDATRYGGRLRPRPHRVSKIGTQLPLPPKRGTAVPHFAPHVCCAQTVAHLSNC